MGIHLSEDEDNLLVLSAGVWVNFSLKFTDTSSKPKYVGFEPDFQRPEHSNPGL